MMIDDFKARFPEIATATVDQWFPVVEPVWPCYFGRPYSAECDKEAILNLVAHLIIVQSTAGTAGLKSTESKSVGSVSVSYSSATQTGGPLYDFLRTTKYGLMFLQVTASSRGAFFV